MRRLILFLLVLALTAAGLVAIFRENLRLNMTAPVPERSEPSSPKEVSVSCVSLPIEVPLESIKRKLTQEFQGRLFFQSGKDIGSGCTLETKVDRVGDFSVTGIGGGIRIEVPLRIWGRVDWSTTKRIKFGFGSKGITVRHHEDYDSRLTLRGDLRIGVDKEWNLVSTTQLTHSWNQKPTLTIGPVKVRITSHADPAVRKALCSLQKKLDSELRQVGLVRESVERIWRELHLVREFGEAPRAWLRMRPESIGLSPITASGSALRLRASVAARIDLGSGSPPATLTVGALPPYRPSDQQRFRVSAAARLNFADVARLVAEQESKTTFDLSNGASVALSAITMYPSEGKVVIGADFTASNVPGYFLGASGTIYLSGTPQFDPTAQMLSIPDLDWHLDTKEIATNLAGWLLDDKIRSKLREVANLPLAAEIEQALARVRRAVAALSIKGVELKVILDDKVTLYGPITEPAGLRVDVTLTGTASAKIHP